MMPHGLNQSTHHSMNVPRNRNQVIQVKKSYNRSRRKSGLILQNMTPQQKLNLKHQYAIWTQQAIEQMQKNAIANITERIPIILGVCNEKTSDHRSDDNSLSTTNEDEQNIITKVHYEIGLWNGVEVGTCKTEKDQYVDYSNTARNWFNRNKAKIYGNHLFYPVIFGKIYKFVVDLKGITDKQKIVIFVDILDGILHSTIQFRRSKAHPLIPHQTFIQPNLFRKACAYLCQYYQVEWDVTVKKQKRQQLPNGQYAKNKERSKNVNKAFIVKIEEIKENVVNKGVNKPLPTFPDYSDINVNALNLKHCDYSSTLSDVNRSCNKFSVTSDDDNNDDLQCHQQSKSTLNHLWELSPLIGVKQEAINNNNSNNNDSNSNNNNSPSSTTLPSPTPDHNTNAAHIHTHDHDATHNVVNNANNTSGINYHQNTNVNNINNVNITNINNNHLNVNPMQFPSITNDQFLQSLISSCCDNSSSICSNSTISSFSPISPITPYNIANIVSNPGVHLQNGNTVRGNIGNLGNIGNISTLTTNDKFNIISPNQINVPFLNKVNNNNSISYIGHRGQHNTVQQSRFTPLLPNNIKISVEPNMNGTVNISLHNINQPQAIQLVSKAVTHAHTRNNHQLYPMSPPLHATIFVAKQN